MKNTHTQYTVSEDACIILTSAEHINIYCHGRIGFMSADMAVDPGGELADPGVDPRQVWSATAWPPADNANQEPATPAWCLTGQRTPRIPL